MASYQTFAPEDGVVGDAGKRSAAGAEERKRGETVIQRVAMAALVGGLLCLGVIAAATVSNTQAGAQQGLLHSSLNELEEVARTPTKQMVGGERVGRTVVRTESASSDRITGMPWGPDHIPFEQYAGYLKPTDAKHMFYWFVESQSDTPEDDPIVFWTNGGPGCSSMMGFFAEHGPFRPLTSTSFSLREFAWNKAANVFYVETPVGCGYSYSTDEDDYDADDESTWILNYDTIVKFFEKFPEYSDNDFFITAESYGGHYIPQLAKYIVDNDDGTQPFSFKGFFLGNPYTDPVENIRGMMTTFGGRHLTELSVYDSWLSECTSEDEDEYYESPCIDYEYEMIDEIGDSMNWYGVDFPGSCILGEVTEDDDTLTADGDDSDDAESTFDIVAHGMAKHAHLSLTDDSWVGTHEDSDVPSFLLTESVVQMRNNMRRFFQKAEQSSSPVAQKMKNLPVYKAAMDPVYMILHAKHIAERSAAHAHRRTTVLSQSVYDPCMGWYTHLYLNRPAVAEALHASTNVTWTECSTAVNYDYSDEENYMESYYTELLESGADLRMMVYSGDDDSVCGTGGTQWWMEAMGWSVVKEWQEWLYRGWDAGYRVVYEDDDSEGQIYFSTVHTAGHEVPMYQPGAAFKLFRHFLNDEI